MDKQAGSKSALSSVKSQVKLRKIKQKSQYTAESHKYKLEGSVPDNIALREAINEILSKSSSSESEEQEDFKVAEEPSHHKYVLEETKHILELQTTALEAKMWASEKELVGEEAPEPETDVEFLNTLGDIPNVDEISLDLTDIASLQKSLEVDSQATLSASTDLGKFVETLSQNTTSHSFYSIKSVTAALASPQELQSDLDDIFQDEEILEIDNARTNHDTRQTAKIEEETFHLFLKSLDRKESQIEDKTDETEALLRAEQERATQANVTDFLHNLIERCVATAENLDKEKIWRNSLDHIKLMKALKTIYPSLTLERKISHFLNKKIVEFFKRKTSFRYITDDDPKTSLVYRKKLQHALHNLDKWLFREEETKSFHATQVLMLRQQFELAKQESYQEVANLEQLMSTTLQVKSLGKTQDCLKKYFVQMSALREEISQVRLTLLLRQHQFSSLKTQKENFEDLGNGLNVHQFESLENETIEISKKIEDFNTSLKRCHNRFEVDLHKMAHLSEKHEMLRNLATAQNQYLKELRQQKRELREYVNQHKLKHTRRRIEIRELSAQSGLLVKPALIKHYDEMFEAVKKLQKSNADLTKNIQELNSKISMLNQNSVA